MTTEDRVLPATKALAALIVPFLLVAFALLYLLPADTDEHFAWTITPTMTPMVLGSVYLGGVWFFIGVIRATQWRTVRAGFPAVALFASLLGLATILHWDRFHHGHVAFVAWTMLYFTTPFLVMAAFVVNDRDRHSASVGSSHVRLGRAASITIAVAGSVILTAGLFLFVVPTWAIRVWP
ncbi:MAG: hypothetical protein ACRD29_17300 [Acidimicrobiales bacterium]